MATWWVSIGLEVARGCRKSVRAALRGRGKRRLLTHNFLRFESAGSPRLPIHAQPILTNHPSNILGGPATFNEKDRDFDRGCSSDTGAFHPRRCVLPSLGKGRIASRVREGKLVVCSRGLRAGSARPDTRRERIGKFIRVRPRSTRNFPAGMGLCSPIESW